jgi:hypothetical protein
MAHGAQDLGNAIYAAYIRWGQAGRRAQYFNAYAEGRGVPAAGPISSFDPEPPRASSVGCGNGRGIAFTGFGRPVHQVLDISRHVVRRIERCGGAHWSVARLTFVIYLGRL